MTVDTEKPVETDSISLFKLITSQSALTEDIINYSYAGSGTEENPYCVEWIPKDPRNPLSMPLWLKWMITLLQALSFFSITFASSALSAAGPQIQEFFNASTNLVIADTSLFILAFAIGPAVWGPLSELYGRQILYFVTYGLVTVFGGVLIASPNIGTLLALRFIAGAFGASAISNAGGVVSDMFLARDRGLATIAFIGAPFLGPSIAPIVCNYLVVAAGWKWVAGLIAIFTGIVFFLGIFLIPETYAPVLLQRRAAKLSKMTGKVYRSKLEIENRTKSAATAFNNAMVRPWQLLFREPIVFFLSIYTAIIYGTMYMEFAAFPIVFMGARGWSQANSGLSFIGVAIGQMLGVIYSSMDDKRYKRLVDRSETSHVTPEARMIPSMIGAIVLPAGLFIFAWTNQPEIHWIACQIGTVLLGFSHVAIFLSVVNYLVDAYTFYAASALAANAVIRALFGAAFPLFTTPMYDSLGINWGSSVSAFAALACAPFPWLLYILGPRIRRHCKYSAESARILDELIKPEQTRRTAIDVVSGIPEQISEEGTPSGSLVAQCTCEPSLDEIVNGETKPKDSKDLEAATSIH